MLPEAYMSHAIAGRMRIKIPSKKMDGSYFAGVREHLSRKEGVELVEANPVTGSVLLIHSLNEKEVIDYAESAGFFRIPVQDSSRTPVSRELKKIFGEFDKNIKRFTGNELDIPGIAFIVLIGLGVFQISRGNFAAPAWYTAFWYAFNIFLKSKTE
jgi:hypothetical protein